VGLVANLKTALGYGPKFDVLASPFSDAQLVQIVYQDIYGASAQLPLSRLEAMGIPAVAKARNLLAGTIAKLPLRVLNSTGILPDDQQPSWTYRTDSAVPPFLRMLWTVDDLLFYGSCLWMVDRGAEGAILNAERVPWEWWTTTPEGAIKVRNELVDANDVIYFPGPVEGLLEKDIETLRSAKTIGSTVAKRVKTPIPVMEIHATGDGGNEPTEAEAKALVAEYNKNRNDPDGATVYTPSSVTLISHGDKADAGFMVEGRNAVRLDVANITGVPASLLEGSVSSASLTYSTSEGKRNEFVDYGLSIWMEAITGRLSQDDVVNRGLHIEFDLTDFLTTTPSPTGLPEQD